MLSKSLLMNIAFFVFATSFQVRGAANHIAPSTDNVDVTLGITSALIGKKGMDMLVINLPDGSRATIDIKPGAALPGGIGLRWNLGKISAASLRKKDFSLHFTNVYHRDEPTFTTSFSLKEVPPQCEERRLTKVRISIAHHSDGYDWQFEAIY